MPWQNQKGVRFLGSGFSFSDDRYLRPWSKTAEFILIYFGDARQQIRCNAAILEQYVAFCGCSIPEHFFPLLFRPCQKRQKLFLVTAHFLSKMLKRLCPSIACFYFARKQP